MNRFYGRTTTSSFGGAGSIPFRLAGIIVVPSGVSLLDVEVQPVVVQRRPVEDVLGFCFVEVYLVTRRHEPVLMIPYEQVQHPAAKE